MSYAVADVCDTGIGVATDQMPRTPFLNSARRDDSLGTRPTRSAGTRLLFHRQSDSIVQLTILRNRFDIENRGACRCARFQPT
jgi:hypothetical protein